MRKIIHGSLHQTTNLELNKLTNKNIIAEIEANPGLKQFLNQFVEHIKQDNLPPNTKELRLFVKSHKQNGNQLPVKPKELKSKAVLYLKALQSLGSLIILSIALVSCSTAPAKVAPVVAAVRTQNTETRKHIGDTKQHIDQSEEAGKQGDTKLDSVIEALQKLLDQ